MSEVYWVGPDRKLVCIPLASWALDVEIKQITPSLERPPVHGENALDKLQVTRCQEKPGGNRLLVERVLANMAAGRDRLGGEG